MTTIPSRLAQRTIISKNLQEASARSRALYRDYYRAAPEICSLYALNVPPSTLRAKFRSKFEETAHVKDLAVLDLLLFKGRIEYQETMNMWKQTSHVMKWFAEEEVSPRLQWEHGRAVLEGVDHRRGSARPSCSGYTSRWHVWWHRAVHVWSTLHCCHIWHRCEDRISSWKGTLCADICISRTFHCPVPTSNPTLPPTVRP